MKCATDERNKYQREDGEYYVLECEPASIGRLGRLLIRIGAAVHVGRTTPVIVSVPPIGSAVGRAAIAGV